MGQTTKIDWCDATFNPVTGCDHGCAYCYARGMARRFKGFLPDHKPGTWHEEDGLYVLDEIQFRKQKNGQIVPTPYPFGFAPTFHRYRLDIPQTWKNPKTIFVGSMADIFGKWVPDEWIIEVLNACRKAPWHRYLFLTKNPERYDALEEADLITDADMNFWLGTTTTDISEMPIETAADNATYSISGIRMDSKQLPKGIYIMNGCKVVIK